MLSRMAIQYIFVGCWTLAIAYYCKKMSQQLEEMISGYDIKRKA